MPWFRRGTRSAPNGWPSRTLLGWNGKIQSTLGDERTQLTQLLDWQRATILMKVDGLDREQIGMTTAALPHSAKRHAARAPIGVPGDQIRR